MVDPIRRSEGDGRIETGGSCVEEGCMVVAPSSPVSTGIVSTNVEGQLPQLPGTGPIQHRFAASSTLTVPDLRSVPDTISHSSPTLKVMTVNAYLYKAEGVKRIFFETPDTERRVQELARFIAAENPDVIFLQEVWQRRWFEALIDGLISEGYFRDLMNQGFTRDRILQDRAIYFSNLGKGNNDLAVIGKHPLSDPQFHPFVWQGSTYVECGKRLADEEYLLGLGTVTLSVNGQEVLLADMHPIHRREEEEGYRNFKAELSNQRAEQLIESWMILEPLMEGRPVLFAGDFNFNPTQWEYRDIFYPLFGLRGSYDVLASEQTAAQGLCTFCRSNPFHPEEDEGVLDHIFGNGQIQFHGAKILTPRPAFTDHEITVADVRILRSEILQNRPGGEAQTKRIPLNEDILGGIIADLEEVDFHSYCLLTDFDEDRAARAIDLLADRVSSTTPIQSKP